MGWMLVMLAGCSTDDWCTRLNLNCEAPVETSRDVVDQDSDVWVAGDDCDDTRSDVYPGAPEICDGADNDCDGTIDEEVGELAYRDTDQDSYGDPDGTIRVYCDSVPLGFVTNNSDCDDADGSSYPGAVELCDDADNDCDGTIDEDSTGLYYPDLDADGYGDDSNSGVYCVTEEPEGFIATGGDCDDTTAAVSPDQREQCFDLVDNNCDDAIDEPECGYPGGFLYSDTRYLQAGRSLSTGDLNGDGFDDVVFGTPSATLKSGSSGAVDVVYGPLAGDVPIDDARDRIYGATSQEQAGFSLTVPGDINQDGYDDLLVGSPYQSVSGQTYAGGAYLFFGPISGLRGTDTADVTYANDITYEYYAYYLDSVGDITNDGVPEIAIWDFSTQSAGVVTLFDGTSLDETNRDSALGVVQASTETLGIVADITGGADMDGDGVADLLFGDALANSYRGAVYLFSGPITGDLQPFDADARVVGAESNAQAGQQLAAPVDLDGDGYADLLTATPNATDDFVTVGALYVALGPLSGDKSLADADVTVYGESARGIGAQVATSDFDRDGAPDLLFAAPRFDTAVEIDVYSLPLPEAGTYRTADFDAEFIISDTSNATALLTDGADVSGDGYDDIIVGLPDLSLFSIYGGGVRYFVAP